MKFLQNKTLLFLGLILLIGGILRFYNLGSTPDSLNWDEVSIGYNAWSISETGKDEYGKFLPLSFRSFDDYKPPLYIYTTVPFVKFFGPTAIAVRLPSVLFGLLSIFGLFLLTLKLTKSRKVSLLSSLTLAISPWHIQFSRVAFESSATIFFVLFGLYFFLKSLESKQSRKIFISVIFFVLGLYTYHSAKVFIPLFVLSLCVIYHKSLIQIPRKYLITSALAGLILALPIFYGFISGSDAARYNATTLINNPSFQTEAAALKLIDFQSNTYSQGKVLHSPPTLTADALAKNYLSHFSPEFLFFTSDNPRHHAPGIGIILLWQIIPLLFGLVVIIKNQSYKSFLHTILAFLFIAPLASTLTNDAPSSVRSLLMVVPISIISGIGLSKILNTKTFFKKTTLTLLVVFFVLNFWLYIHQYFVHLNYETADSWQFGRKEAAILSDQIKDNYDKVVVSQSLEQSYIFWLFYLRIDPKIYLNSGGTSAGFQGTQDNHFDKFYFQKFEEQNLKGQNILLVGAPKDFYGKQPDQTIELPNGQPVIELMSASKLYSEDTILPKK